VYLLSYVLLPWFLTLSWRTFLTHDSLPRSDVARLFLLQCLWANLHSGFLWGWIITATLAGVRTASIARTPLPPAEKTSRTLTTLAWATLIAAAPLLNPFGVALLADAAGGAIRAFLRPPSVEWASLPAVATPLTVAAWITLLILSLSFILQGSRRLPALVLLAVASLLCLRGYRHVGSFALLAVALPFLAAPERPETGNPGLHTLLLTAVAAALLGFFFFVCSNRLYYCQHELKRFGTGVITSELPVDCSDFAAAHGLRGRFLNDWQYGGYLVWRLWPQIRVAEDGRTAPFPAALHQQLDAVFAGDAAALKSVQLRYRPAGAFVPWINGSLIAHLSRDPDWHCVFIGSHSTLWLTSEAVVRFGMQSLCIRQENAQRFVIRDPCQARAEDPWLTYPTALFRRGFVLLCMGHVTAAREELLRLREVAPSSPLTRRLEDLLGVR